MQEGLEEMVGLAKRLDVSYGTARQILMIVQCRGRRSTRPTRH